MFFYLSKFLGFILDPFVLFFLLALLGLRKMNSGKAKRIVKGALLFLYLFSNSFIYNEFALAWEPKAVVVDKIDKHYEAAIILGGVAGYDPSSQQMEFYENAERILNVLPLYFEGKVEKILLAGGSGRVFSNQSEAEILADYLLKIGIKKEDLIIEKKSRNTFENAKFSIALLEKENLNGNVLLSTSATHMKRSYLCFLKLGKSVDIYPVDHTARKREFYLDTLILPKAKNLHHWYWLIHEWMGILFYKLSGYC